MPRRRRDEGRGPPGRERRREPSEHAHLLARAYAGSSRRGVAAAGWNLHTGAEVGIDDLQASRSPDGRYRTTPLRGLWSHPARGFYHDGRFGTLREVIDHYDATLGLGLTDADKGALAEYLKSL